MKLSWKEDRYGIMAMALFTAVMFLIAFLTHGTGDEGDSIMHYLFARYAFGHPENFIHHWAKPFYVLIMAPFARFGFMSAKLFNTFLSCIAVWFTYLIAREMKYKWAIAVFVIALFFKNFMVVAFSGLTEPLNDALIAIAIYLAFTQRYMAATIIMSFLPFIRSEGLFLCGTFALYLLWLRQWRLVPLLLLGHIIYSIAGYHHYKDFLWVIHQIPYGYHNTHYGHGSWSHFITQMPMITGVLNAVLLSVGMIIMISLPVYLFYKKRPQDISKQSIFIVGLFLIFFAMHASFWALGIFASFGLVRVFVAIACVMILIMLTAIEYIDQVLSKYVKWHAPIIIAPLLALYLIFALNKSPYSYRHYDFGLHADQEMDEEMAAYVKKNYPDYKNRMIYFDAVYLSMLLDVDVFDENKYGSTGKPANHVYPNKSIIIWDAWYSDHEQLTHLDVLRDNKQLKEITSFERTGLLHETYHIKLFVRED